jgi:hypothetical protein
LNQIISLSSDDIVKAEFVIEDAQVTRLGLQLEEMLKEMIWFKNQHPGKAGFEPWPHRCVLHPSS